MTLERLAPDAILELSGASPSTLSFLTDDPDAPDGNWIQANSSTRDPILRTSFATPHATPTVGAGLQEFRVLVRKNNGAGLTPTVTVALYEAGVQKAISASIDVTSAVGQVVSFLWDASLLTGSSGLNVEVRIVATHANFLVTNVSVDFGAVEWNATEAAIPYAGSSGSSGGAVNQTAFSASYAGSSGSSGVSADAEVNTADYVGSSGSDGSSEDTSSILIGGVGSSGSDGGYFAQAFVPLVAHGSNGSNGSYEPGAVQYTPNAGSSGSSGSYEPTVTLTPSYMGSGGASGAVQTFTLIGTAYAGSSGSNGVGEPGQELHLADYLGSSGSSGRHSETPPPCDEVTADSPLLPVCTVSGPI